MPMNPARNSSPSKPPWAALALPLGLLLVAGCAVDRAAQGEPRLESPPEIELATRPQVSPKPAPWLKSRAEIDDDEEDEMEDAAERDPAPKRVSRAASRLGIGAGFTVDPVMYYQSVSAEYYLRPSLTIGPEVGVGVSDDELYFAPSFIVTQYAPLSDELNGYARGSLGFAYLEKDHRPGDDSDIDLSLGAAAGLRYELRADISIGSEVGVSFFPGELEGEDAIFTFKILNLGIRF